MIILEMKKKQYYYNREAAKNQHHHLEKLINMNILQVEKYYFVINAE